jgi:small subunit ribosomal protein S14
LTLEENFIIVFNGNNSFWSSQNEILSSLTFCSNQMAKQSMIQREKKRERLISKYSLKRKTLKDELKKAGSFTERLALYKKMESVPRNSSPSRHRNRCWVTGRSRGFYKDFGLSRHVLREMGNEGLIPGLTKSSW